MDASLHPDPDPDVRIVLAASRTSRLGGVAARLGAGFDVCGVVDSADAAVAAVAAQQPDVVVVGSDVPEPPLTIAGRVSHALSRGKLIVVVERGNDEDCLEYLLAGASGYVAGEIDHIGLARVVRSVAAGRAVVPPTAQRRLIEELRA